VWGMGYDRIMGYGVDFPLYQLGNTINLWVITGYGLSQVWVKTVSTVVANGLATWLREKLTECCVCSWIATDCTCSDPGRCPIVNRHDWKVPITISPTMPL
ncbi:hypothetical protein BD413DRAFT_478223, partial [Trametes elegans]